MDQNGQKMISKVEAYNPKQQRDFDHSSRYIPPIATVWATTEGSNAFPTTHSLVQQNQRLALAFPTVIVTDCPSSDGRHTTPGAAGAVPGFPDPYPYQRNIILEYNTVQVLKTIRRLSSKYHRNFTVDHPSLHPSKSLPLPQQLL